MFANKKRTVSDVTLINLMLNNDRFCFMMLLFIYFHALSRKSIRRQDNYTSLLAVNGKNVQNISYNDY